MNAVWDVLVYVVLPLWVLHLSTIFAIAAAIWSTPAEHGNHCFTG